MPFVCPFYVEEPMKSYSISQRKKTRGNLTWYAREYENGVLLREFSLKTTRKADAKAWLDAMNAARFMPEAIANRMAPVDKPMSSAYTAFYNTIEASTKGRTRFTYRSQLQQFLTWCALEDVDTMRQFTAEKAAEFAKSVSQSMSPSTAKNLLMTVKRMLDWCADSFGMEGYNPMKKIKPPKESKREKKFWTNEEIDLILDNAPSKDYRLFWAIMAFAGLRHSEAASFGPSSLVGGRLHLVGKGDKEAYIPVSDRLKDEIVRHGDISEGMFTGNGFNSFRSNNALRKVLAKVGLDPSGMSNHSFRHSFISNKIRSGVNVKAVSLLARHSDINVTLNTYSHLLQEDLTEAANK